MVTQTKKETAIALRKQGKSYKVIEKKIGIARSTLSGWFAKHPWSKEIKASLEKTHLEWSRRHMHRIGKARADGWRARRKKAREDAGRMFPTINHDPLFIAGCMLYWGEGDRNIATSSVKLTNTDPAMIYIFSLFLQRYLVPKNRIKLDLIIYPDLNEARCKVYWSKKTKIALTRFNKTQVIHGRHPTKKLHYGIAMIHTESCEQKEKILMWISLYKKTLCDTMSLSKKMRV